MRVESPNRCNNTMCGQHWSAEQHIPPLALCAVPGFPSTVVLLGGCVNCWELLQALLCLGGWSLGWCCRLVLGPLEETISHGQWSFHGELPRQWLQASSASPAVPRSSQVQSSLWTLHRYTYELMPKLSSSEQKYMEWVPGTAMHGHAQSCMCMSCSEPGCKAPYGLVRNANPQRPNAPARSCPAGAQIPTPGPPSLHFNKTVTWSQLMLLYMALMYAQRYSAIQL